MTAWDRNFIFCPVRLADEVNLLLHACRFHVARRALKEQGKPSALLLVDQCYVAPSKTSH